MRFTAVQEQPEIPKHEAFCEIHREMYCLGCNTHSCTARPGASGQSVVPHSKLLNSIRVRTPFLTACHHWLTNHSIPRPNGLWFLGADAVNWPLH